MTAGRFSMNWIEPPAGGSWLRAEWQRKRAMRSALYGPRFGFPAGSQTQEAADVAPDTPQAAGTARSSTSGADGGAGDSQPIRSDAGDPFRRFAEAARQFRHEQGLN